VVTKLDEFLSQLVRVNKQESLVQLKWNSLVTLLNVFEGVQKNIVSILVVTQFLLLLSDVNCDFDSLGNIADGSVQFESPLRFLRNIVTLTHEVIDKFVSQSFHFDLADHFNHVRNHILTLAHVELECLTILLTLLVVLGGFTPHGLAFVELSNLQVLLSVAFIDLQNNLGVFVHFLVRLSNNESFFSLATED